MELYTNDDYLQQGVNAYKDGLLKENNPFAEKSLNWMEWNQGWDLGKKKNAKWSEAYLEAKKLLKQRYG